MAEMIRIDFYLWWAGIDNKWKGDLDKAKKRFQVELHNG